MDEISLISNSDSFFRWESEWIGWLLSEFDVESICDPALTTIRKRVVLVLSGDIRGQEQIIDRYIADLRHAGGRVGVFHISDEWFVYPIGYYKDVDFVFRNHWRPGVIDGVHCRYLPLGYPNGKAGTGSPKPLRDRQYEWSFIGEPKRQRLRMLAAGEKLGNGFKHLTGK